MLKVWIARDKGGGLEVHSGLPKKIEDDDSWWDTSSGEGFHISPDHPWGDDLTWEDEPKELNLVEIEQVEALKETMRKQDEVIGYFVHAELTTLQIRWKDLNNHENDEDIIEQFGQILHKRIQELKTNQS